MVVVSIDGESLTIEDVIKVARHGEKVVLDDTTRTKIQNSRAVIERALDEGRTVYGVNTGFGNLANVSIDRKDLAALQVNLIRSHSVGVGNPFPSEVVRGMMVLWANALSKGFSGIRLEVVETLLAMLNKDVVPVVPEQGSVGSSGDLAPLAHMVLVMIGEGEAYHKGERIDGAEAMKKAGIIPVELQAKEGVALINGTQPMTSVGVLAIHDAMSLVRNTTIAAAMTLEALRGTRVAYDPRIHEIRPHEGQSHIAEAMRKLLPDSEINQSHADCGMVQDAYSLRCIPQVLGASLDTFRYVRSVLETEINSATDNPLVFPESDTVLSGGNFHGQPIALVMDFLGIALSEIANMSERRVNRIVNPNLSGLPAFLTKDGGLQSGMMILQYTAAALVSENKILAHPASVDSIPTSADQEDHVSMGTIAARKARTILDNVVNVIAIEYLCATQGVDFLAPLKPSAPLESVRSTIREEVPTLEKDRELHKDITAVRGMMNTNKIVEAAEKVIGSFLEE
ncbi:MAG: histidine ammonia-lyase [Candidatus Thorarchaeota archaeon]|nr:histidine ammonia-lyase [Candidatus Thorarchaeota archaeon]